MTNKKTTKRALLFSVLSMVLCVSMLMGTTFAWFTDSVTSANNIIKSGNLDIELEYWNDGEWKTVDNASDILTNTLWEPGVTEVAYLRVANAGSLALQYRLGINIVSETAGKNVDGKTFLLSDYIQFGVVENIATDATTKAPTTYATREDAVAAVTNAQKISAGYVNADDMASGDELYLALVVYMPTSVGNEANHDGVNVPMINLGINVFATQYTSEADSYGNDYDAITVVGNEAELAAALKNGGEVMLAGNIAVTENAVKVPAGVKAVLNLNGNTITGTTAKDSGNQCTIQVKGDLTVKGNGAITTTHTGANMAWGAFTSVFSVEGGTLTLEEGVEVIHFGGSDMAFGVDVNSTLGETVLNANGANIYSSYTAVREFNNSQAAKAIVNLNSGIISGDKRDIWVQNPSASAVSTNGVVNIASDYTYDVETQSSGGRIYDFDYGYTLVSSAAGLQNALDSAVNGEVIKLSNNITGNVTATQKPDVKVVIDGSGKTFAGVITVDGKSATYTTAGLTIKNVVFKADSIDADACIRLGDGTNATRYTCNVTVDGCTFDVPGAVGVKSYTGGDKNLTITNCEATAAAHSLVQAKGIDGILVEDCTINSKNGMNFNNSDNVTVLGCTADVKGYAVRFGEGSAADTAAETYTIKNCTLKSACAESGDAVIILRGTAANATLTLEGTTLTGTTEIINNAVNAKVI